MIFREIEHKYLLDQIPFSWEALEHRIMELEPVEHYVVEVMDTYFYVPAHAEFVYRHRIDERIQEFTLKSLADGSENRLEVNLRLSGFCQKDAVKMFLSPFGKVQEF